PQRNRGAGLRHAGARARRAPLRRNGGAWQDGAALSRPAAGRRRGPRGPAELRAGRRPPPRHPRRGGASRAILPGSRRRPAADADPMSTPAPRSLVIRRDNIGDLVCTTPLIAALRRRYPEAWIAALVNHYAAPVLDNNPDLDAVFSYEKAKHLGDEESRLASY